MAISLKHKSLAVVTIVSLAMVLGAVLRGTIRGEGPNVPSVILNVEPASLSADPGPTLTVGVDEDPKGVQFVSSDLYVSGDGSYRVYFDYQDKSHFHFLDRKGENASLGLIEAGLEQVFCSAKITPGIPLRIARHSSHIGLFQAGRLILSAFDDRLIRGSAGYRMLAAGPAISLKVEAREDIHFADDFMIVDKKAAQWRGNGDAKKGDFLVKSLKNPLLSANAFSYLGVGKNIYSVVGEPWWDQYRYESALRGPVDGKIGLVFAFQDEKNYGLFRWTAKKVNGADVADPGKRELVRVKDGKEEVLQQWPGGYFPDQWYTAVVRMTYSRISVAIDGHPLMEISDPSLTSGAAGVWCDLDLPVAPATETKAQPFQVNSLNDLMKQHAVFDDVRLDTLDGFEDNFSNAGQLSGGWLMGSGGWKVAGQAPATELLVSPGSTNGASAKALIGDRRWAQYELECDVQPGAGKAGIVFLHRDEGNYYAATLDGNSLTLTRVSEGREEAADSVPFPRSDAKVRLRATIKHGHVRVVANESASVETFDSSTILKGRAGLIASVNPKAAENAGIAFGRFRLSFLPEPEPLVTTNAIFEEEFTESWHEWTSPASEWYAPREQGLVDGRPRNLLWHRSQFPGDVELVLEPRDISEPKYEMALSVAKDGKGSNNGYVFRYKTGDMVQGSRMTTVQLFRQGEKVGEKLLPEDVRQLSSVSIRRCGKYIVGLVNGSPVLSFGDQKPLVGSKVAFYTQGVSVRTESAKIISENFRNDLFSSAPSNWRTAGNAIAEVTNRWQCDPRWSFFSLKNDRKAGKPAVLWSKKLYPGDVSVEFYVGNKMEGERGTPYTYARDINVTIGSDGSDLNKGYTFMFGGQGNTGSMILRNGVEVKRIARTIPTDMNFHRHWFAVKIEKTGGTLTFRVDRYFDGAQNELVFEDPNPLPGGDHLALWTYDHAIMISRVRISGDGGKVSDHPDWAPSQLKTPYDGK